MKTYVLYNKLSNNSKGQTTAEQLKTHWANRELTFVNARELDDYAGFFAGLQPDDEVCVCGGDGTLNYLINHVDCDSLTNKIFYFPAGSGNDFWTDLGKKPGDAPAQINRYIKNLPTVTVKGKTSKFINGVGYGIDGYCCEEGDRLREKSDKPINYTSIAIKGLLFRYQPTNAEVIVDGKTYTFQKAWLAPTMKGRFYGAGKLRTLMDFPTIFKGEHVKKSSVHVMKGKEITVRFDRPVALQIDGETVLAVSEYTVKV